MSNAEALRTATSVAAAALALEGSTGAVCEGLLADLLVVHGDPLDEIERICSPPLAVVANGVSVQPCPGLAGDGGGGGRGKKPLWSLSIFGSGGAAASVGTRERHTAPAFGSSAQCPCNQ